MQDLKQKFEAWLYGVPEDLFGLQIEYFYEDLKAYKEQQVSYEAIVAWLKAAYEQGYLQAEKDSK